MSIKTLGFLLTLALLVFWAIGAHNRLVRLKNSIAHSYEQIDVQLKNRYDLITNLLDAAKKYLLHEEHILDAVMTAHTLVRSASDAVRIRPTNSRIVTTWTATEQTLEGSLSQLFAVAETYPEFKGDLAIQALGEELTSTESKVNFARQTYNDAVLSYNNARRQFPVILISRLFGFAPSAMLRVTKTVKERQVVHIQL